MAKMTAKELAFVGAFCTHGNMAQAVIDAGWKPRSRQAASQRGHELLQKPQVAAAIKAAMENTGVNVRRIFQELISQTFGRDISDFEPFLNGKQSLADLKAAGVNLRLVKKVRRSERVNKYGKNISREIELVDGQKALEMLGRHLGMFRRDEQETQAGPPPVAQSVLADVRNRLADAERRSPHPETQLKDDD